MTVATIRIGQDAINNPNPNLVLALRILADFGLTADPMSTSTNGKSAVTSAPSQKLRPGVACVPMTIVIDRTGLVLVTSSTTGFSASFQAVDGSAD